MDKQARVRDIILQLKTIKEDKDLSCQDILEMVEASGGVTSMSTVRRVFAEGSENQNFSYRNTIQPISRAMLAVDETEKVADVPDNVLQAQMDGLKQACELKDMVISELNKELADERKKVEHLLRQTELVSRVCDELMETIKRERAAHGTH